MAEGARPSAGASLGRFAQCWKRSVPLPLRVGRATSGTEWPMRDSTREREAELLAEIRALEQDNQRLRTDLANLAKAVLAATQEQERQRRRRRSDLAQPPSEAT